MKYSLSWLLQQPLEQVAFLFFWGNRPWRAGVADKSCFSQWFEASFVVDGTTYATAEHWMMAGKARLFEDTDILAQVLVAHSPAEARKLGKLVRNFEQANWDKHKYELIKEGNLHKFSQNAYLTDFLLATDNRVLVEASPVDVVWGIGLPSYSPAAFQPTQWRGQNLLGFALMEVRDQLRNT